jgi:adenylate cyclase
MGRPRPITRLIDGPRDASGQSIARRSTLLMIPAMVGANAVGAVVVFVLLVWVLPRPEHLDSSTVTLVNLVAASVYLAAGSVAGILLGLRSFRSQRDWLRAEREPTEKERRATLRGPLRQLFVNGGIWLVAAVAFTGLNLVYSGRLAIIVGITVVLGGLSTCASAYLLAERIGRPAAARALSAGLPERPVLPGVTARAMLAWMLGTAVPLMGLLSVAIVALASNDVDVTELAITALGLAGVAMVVGLLLTFQAARGTSAPLASLRRALQRVEQGDLEAEVRVFDGSELGLLQAGFNRMGAGLREREEMRDLFGRHVGEDVAREALDRGIELGGEELDAAVLFVDLKGSTKLASEREPGEVVSLLNEFFGAVVEVVEEHGGWINKFEGDAALAVFGAPIPRDDPAGSALAAAREMARRLPDAVPDLSAGIGVSFGRVVAGNIGSESRFEYTVIGDPVNEAARLCELAKERPEGVLASATAVEAAEDSEAGSWRIEDAVELRGRSRETRPAVPA